MFDTLLAKVFGTRNDRELKRLRPIVSAINEAEDHIQTLSNNDLKNKTAEFRDRLSQNESLEDILPEAFATVRETSRRILEMRHF
ncbi:MAG TPA: hypothetical protein EYM91_02475, partial [Acidobacteria bacterium]|nr:hypothetical protein [Acidobacteriota bacterium]